MANVGATLSPINFQTKEMQAAKGGRKTDRKESSKSYYVVAGALVAVAAGLFAVPFMQYKSVESDKKDLEDQINSISEINAIVNDYYSAKDKFDDLNGYDALTANDEEYLIEFINTLEKVMPSDMKITALNTTSGLTTMNVTCKDKTQVADFITSLKEDKNVGVVVCTDISEELDDESNVNLVTATLGCNFVNDAEKKAELEQAAQAQQMPETTVQPETTTAAQ